MKVLWPSITELRRRQNTEVVPFSDQIIIETTNEIISEEALEISWDIQKGKRAETHIKSAMHGMFKLSWENSISNSSNAQYYFRGSVKRVICYSSGIRNRIKSSTILLNYWDFQWAFVWNIGGILFCFFVFFLFKLLKLRKHSTVSAKLIFFWKNSVQDTKNT